MSRKTQKKLRKLLTLVSCAVLLVCVTIGATVAYLTSTSEEVKNTFTVGKVGITLDEAKVDAYGDVVMEQVVNEEGQPVLGEDDKPLMQPADRVTTNAYKLVPDHTYTKDPTIHVATDSENCILFVKLNNGLAGAEDNTKTIASQMATLGWTLVGNTQNIYYYNKVVEKGSDVVVFEKFTFDKAADPDSYKNAEITVTAYAVQADGFVSSTATGTSVIDTEAAGAWTAAKLG